MSDHGVEAWAFAALGRAYVEEVTGEMVLDLLAVQAAMNRVPSGEMIAAWPVSQECQRGVSPVVAEAAVLELERRFGKPGPTSGPTNSWMIDRHAGAAVASMRERYRHR